MDQLSRARFHKQFPYEEINEMPIFSKNCVVKFSVKNVCEQIVQTLKTIQQKNIEKQSFAATQTTLSATAENKNNIFSQISLKSPTKNN